MAINRDRIEYPTVILIDKAISWTIKSQKQQLSYKFKTIAKIRTQYFPR